MKKSLFFLFLFLCLRSFSQEVLKIDKDFDIQPYYTGVQGVEILKVFIEVKKEKNSLEVAKKNAMQAILFQGISGSGSQSPFITISELDESKKVFFNKFFEKKEYLKFVNIANDGSIAPGDFKRVGKMYRIGYILKVEKAQLRRYLEENGIIRKLGL
jgi:hypothetical protein